MTTAHERAAVRRQAWNAGMPTLIARWGLVGALVELDALATHGDGALPAPAANLRAALDDCVEAYRPRLDATGVAQATRTAPLAVPAGTTLPARPTLPAALTPPAGS